MCQFPRCFAMRSPPSGDGPACPTWWRPLRLRARLLRSRSCSPMTAASPRSSWRQRWACLSCCAWWQALSCGSRGAPRVRGQPCCGWQSPIFTARVRSRSASSSRWGWGSRCSSLSFRLTATCAASSWQPCPRRRRRSFSSTSRRPRPIASIHSSASIPRARCSSGCRCCEAVSCRSMALRPTISSRRQAPPGCCRATAASPIRTRSRQGRGSPRASGGPPTTRDRRWCRSSRKSRRALRSRLAIQSWSTCSAAISPRASPTCAPSTGRASASILSWCSRPAPFGERR